MLKVQQVAERLNTSKSTIYSLIEAGKLSCFRLGVGGGAIRVSEQQLADFLEACEQDASTSGMTMVAGASMQKAEAKTNGTDS